MLRPVVELVGIAGCGKTTLMQLLVERIEASGKQAWTNRQVSDRFLGKGSLARGAAQIPILGRPIGSLYATYIERRRQDILRAFQSEHQEGWARAQARLVSIDAATPEEGATLRGFVERHAFLLGAHRTYAEPGRILVADEGIAQRAVNLFAVRTGETQHAEAAAFLDDWAMPDVIVHVEASLEACEARILRRGLPTRLRGRPAEEITAFLYSSGRIVEEIRMAGVRRQIPVVSIPNGGDLAELEASSDECFAEVSRAMAN